MTRDDLKFKGFTPDGKGGYFKPKKAIVATPTPTTPQIKQPQSSKLELKFDALWKTLNGPSLVSEFKFHPVRRWRFDRAHLQTKVAIELNGGIWNGRHTRGGGYEQDRIKVHEAQVLGWRVFELTPAMITAEVLSQIIFLIVGVSKPGPGADR